VASHPLSLISNFLSLQLDEAHNIKVELSSVLLKLDVHSLLFPRSPRTVKPPSPSPASLWSEFSSLTLALRSLVIVVLICFSLNQVQDEMVPLRNAPPEPSRRALLARPLHRWRPLLVLLLQELPLQIPSLGLQKPQELRRLRARADAARLSLE
jgi:hypothetical protein